MKISWSSVASLALVLVGLHAQVHAQSPELAGEYILLMGSTECCPDPLSIEYGQGELVMNGELIGECQQAAASSLNPFQATYIYREPAQASSDGFVDELRGPRSGEMGDVIFTRTFGPNNEISCTYRRAR